MVATEKLLREELVRELEAIASVGARVCDGIASWKGETVRIVRAYLGDSVYVYVWPVELDPLTKIALGFAAHQISNPFTPDGGHQ